MNQGAPQITKRTDRLCPVIPNPFMGEGPVKSISSNENCKTKPIQVAFLKTKNAKQTQISALSIENQRLPKKQTQNRSGAEIPISNRDKAKLNPAIMKKQNEPKTWAKRLASYCILQNKAKLWHFQPKNKDYSKNKAKSNSNHT
jgi:hypothetical protein